MYVVLKLKICILELIWKGSFARSPAVVYSAVNLLNTQWDISLFSMEEIHQLLIPFPEEFKKFSITM